MNWNILLALDGSAHSMQSAYYVANMLSKRDDVRVTLLTVLPIVPPSLPVSRVLETVSTRSETEVTFAEKKMLLETAEQEVEQTLFAPVRETFRMAGFTDEQIAGKCLSALPGSNVAKEIDEECRKGDYDTIVIGKHGHSGIRELVLGSVAEKVIKLVRDRAVWVIG
jgi:nucleotide-binding universal stress UspA family protein